MSERDGSHDSEPPSRADRTLLGVAPPRLESSSDSPLRSPVFVRSGTSVADVEPPPLPRMALPSRPPRPLDGAATTAQTPPLEPLGGGGLWERSLLVARAQPALWMVLAPAVLAGLVIGVAVATSSKPAPKPAPARAVSLAALAPELERAAEKPVLPPLAELEAKPPGSLSASELVRLAAGRRERRLADAKAFCERVALKPALAGDKAVQVELLRLANDSETGHEVLATLAALESSLGADLLYEVWTGTAQRSDEAELARALVYSVEVRSKASAALSVALDLRAAQSCAELKAALPRALKDGDRRSLVPLTKLGSRRGCGPKKKDDCYACLRDQPDELTATTSAVKSRRAPAYPAVGNRGETSP